MMKARPGDLIHWDGTLDALQTGLTAAAVSTDRHKEIWFILQAAHRDNHTELLDFLVHTEPSLAPQERAQLMVIELLGPATYTLVQSYQLSQGALLHWQHQCRLMTEQGQRSFSAGFRRASIALYH